jgi:hypothetical protein
MINPLKSAICNRQSPISNPQFPKFFRIAAKGLVELHKFFGGYFKIGDESYWIDWYGGCCSSENRDDCCSSFYSGNVEEKTLIVRKE